ncbi:MULTISPECIES: sigma-70 family RNA polymerase sigma factor [Clostridium]|uniref:RNA polymerase sigma factor n=2 Tax=Clostridium butyricum TaxID=1492 RepID=C4IEH8_CLOBU|nr:MULTISPECIES: sigma-70 family RNA polymerase sigma factor [Clostridium]APF25034.1 RNA polymerase sigma factor sigV [Clostridium butyricum]AXB86183.1 RNA polymerase subunit sigma-70 [Clostridium butyricum]EDT73489.1 RNA polymerase sigma factor SigV [Clostridium butyricum 5521]EEP55632.1 RNA polymerase sigma factor SigV [Clostridium butyricum E4 str. BoNT E BL5262]EMU53403.1 RNA polymerase sigma factor SigV [Clostridium butyricum DKU-01]
MLAILKRKKVEKYIIENREYYYRLAYSYVKNEADSLDVIQESIIKALISIESLKEIEKVKSWFYKIVIRTSIDYIRKNKKYNDMIDISEIINNGKSDQYKDLDLYKALDELDETYKTIIILRYFEDMKINDIADILDENPNTVKTRLYAGLKKLKIDIGEC